MNDLIKAISVGEYPAKCFHGGQSEKQHRRFLRSLAVRGIIGLLDSVGNPHDRESIKNGAIHFANWYVTPHDAQVIPQKFEEETARVDEERRQAEEQKRKEAEEQERQREQNEEAWRKEVAELKAAGLWLHPVYKTLKAARADGWRERKEGEVGGEEISLKGHVLVRNAVRQRYVYKTTLSKVYGLTPSMIEELGEPDKTCNNPHWKTGPYSASLYLIERVEAWIEENKERLEKAKESRPKRSAAMTAVHKKQRDERWKKAQEWVTTLPITINRPLPSTLLADARKQYTIPDHVDLLRTKALFAHVRHRQSNYEALLQELYQQEFSNDLYPLLRQRIDPLVQEAVVEWHAGRENHQ